MLSDYFGKAMNTAQYQATNVFRGYGRGEIYYLHLKISLFSQLLHTPLKRNHTNEKIFSSTKFLSTVKDNYACSL